MGDRGGRRERERAKVGEGQEYLDANAVSGATQGLNNGLARVSHGEHSPITLRLQHNLGSGFSV